MTQEASERPMRERIKEVAGEFYVLRGHDGFSFGDVAEAIGTTRANIHHHFGNKRQLMAELVDGFVTDAERRIIAHWTEGEASLSERLSRQLEDLHRFYRRFNPKPGDRNVWSPVSRLRLDLPALGDIAVTALERVGAAYDKALSAALTRAVERGELDAQAPVADLARVLRLTLLSCGPNTLDTGSFDEIERLFLALDRSLLAVWKRR